MKNSFRSKQVGLDLIDLPVVLTLFLALCGCVEVRDKNDSSAPAFSSTPPSQQTSEDLKSPAHQKSTDNPAVKIVPLQNPRQYAIHLVIPEGATGLQRRLLIPDEIRSKPRFLNLSGQLKIFVDEDVIEASKYVYRFSRAINGQNEFFPEFEVDLPQDYVIEPGFAIPPGKTPFVIAGFERVFFKRGTVLTTWGRDLSIHGKQLIVEEARIETFPAGLTADPSLSGRSGGKILLQFEEAHGHLTLNLRGENGAPGRAGATQPEAQKGMNSTYGMPFSGVCQSTPGAVLPENGHPGLPGSRGGDGGDSGSAVLNIKDARDLILDNTIEGGLAGAPGAGGPGQRGGPAGLNCYGEPGGPRGTDGAQGPSGPAARAGANETVCLISQQPASSCR